MPDHMERLKTSVYHRIAQDPGLPHPNPTASHWQNPPHTTLAHIQSPILPSETDILIIGSGITGCSLAKHLLESSSSDPESNYPRITILEARSLCSGATGRNGGHIKAVPEFHYAELLAALGKERANEIVKFTLANVEALLNVSEGLPEEMRRGAEVRRVQSVNVFTSEKAMEEFRTLLDVFESDHGRRGRLISADELKKDYNIHNAPGAYLSSAAAAWPYRLVTSLFSQLLDHHPNNLTLETHTPAQKISYNNAPDTTYPYKIHTPRGSINAKTLIHATNAHASHLLPLLRSGGALYPVRGQMTAQKPSSQFGTTQGATRSWSLHHTHGFDYMTQTPSSSGEIFLGGGLAQASERGLAELGNVRDDENSTLASAHLGGIANVVWGGGEDAATTESVVARWTGVMGFTGDGLPLVGRLDREVTGREGAGEWIAAGFCGYGMVNAWLAGRCVADLVLRREDSGELPKAYLITKERLEAMGRLDPVGEWMKMLGLA